MLPKQRIDPVKIIGVDNDTLVINSIEYFHSNSEDFAFPFIGIPFFRCGTTMDQQLHECIMYLEERLKLWCGRHLTFRKNFHLLIANAAMAMAYACVTQSALISLHFLCANFGNIFFIFYVLLRMLNVIRIFIWEKCRYFSPFAI